MVEAIKIYKNSQEFGGVILIEIFDKEVDNFTKDNHITKLYHQDQLVGLNIFDKNLFKDYEDGFIYPNQPELLLLNTYLKEHQIDLTFNYQKEKYLKVAQVLEVDKVSGSDNLSLCKVLVDDKHYSMICGASNVTEGMKTIAALDNALLDDGTKVSAGEVLGVFSEGMLCSLKELGLDPKGEYSGIVKLADDETVGTSFYEVDWRKYNV